MCSPASVILTSIATILVSFEAILERISLNINFRSQFQGNFPTISFKIDQNCFKTYKYCDNTCKYYTCRWTHFSSIGSILVSITSILTSIATILASIEQVNTPLVLKLIYEHHGPFVTSIKKIVNIATFINFFSNSLSYYRRRQANLKSYSTLGL